MAAKQIIAERKEVRLPIVEYQSTLQYAPSKVHTAERLLRLDEVELEVWMDNIRPDIRVQSGDERYLVEVAVTHFVDEEKHAKIQAQEIPAFEVDLKSLKDNFTFSALEKLLFDAPYPAKWIFNKEIEDMAAVALKTHEHVKHCALELERQAAEARELAKKIKESQNARASLQRQESFRRYRAMPPTEKLERNIRELGISHAQMAKFTTFTPCGNSFGVPQNVWQSSVLVFMAKNEAKAWAEDTSSDIQFQECLVWMRQTFNVHSPVPDGDSIAIWKYFKHLETLGILGYLWNRKFALKIKSRNWPRLFTPTKK